MTTDEQNFMDWCQRNGIPWPGTCSPMCLAWVTAAREERNRVMAQDSYGSAMVLRLIREELGLQPGDNVIEEVRILKGSKQ